jgi:DNA-binding CsgD family transcriptional regulator
VHLVGRDDVLSRIRFLIAGGGRAGAAAVLVTGEAGIGKTAVLRQSCCEADGAGWRVGVTAATGLDRALPFNSLRLALHRLSGPGPTVDRFDRAIAPGCRDDTPFAAAVALLRPMLDRGPVLLAADDLQHVDPDSVAVLAGLVRHFAGDALLVLVTAREPTLVPSDAVADLRRTLATEEFLQDFSLVRLTRQEVATMAERLLDRSLEARELDGVIAASHGIPFFVEECLQDDGVQVASSRHQRVLRRVLPLDGLTRSVARAIAVIGPVSLPDLVVLASVVQEPASEVEAAFDRLVRGGLLAARDDGFAFAHDVIADALATDVGPAEARRLHRRAAEFLLSARANGAPVDVIRVARHLEHAGVPGDVEAARVLASAAKSMERVAPLTAARWYELALSLIDPSHAEWPRWSLQLVIALERSGDVAAVRRVGRRVLPDMTPGQLRKALAVAVAAGENYCGRARAAVDLIDTEIGRDTDSVGALSQLSLGLLNLGLLDDADEVSRRGISLAVDGTVESVGMHAHRSLVLAARGDGPAAARMMRTLQDSVSTASRPFQVFATTVGASNLASQGMLDGVEQMVHDVEPWVRPIDHPAIRLHLAHAKAVLATWSGQWETALELIDEVLSSGPVIRGLELELRCTRAEILGAQGEDEEAMRELASLEGTPDPLRGFATHAALGAALANGRPDLAVARYRGVAVDHAMAAERYVEACLDVGDTDAARAELPRLRAWRGNPTALFASLRATARVEHDIGPAARALDLLHRSPVVHRFELARTELLLGQLGDEPGVRLARAVEQFRDLGAEPWRRVAAGELRRRGLAIPRRKRRLPGVLSESERSITELVWKGLTNAEIATELAYSPRTVSVYLSRIYARLGVAGRVELTRLVDEGYLTD